MKNPCETCIECDFCWGEFPCKKRLAYLKWKEAAERVRKHTQEVMRRARIK